MDNNTFYDETLGNVTQDGEQWQAQWQWNDKHAVDVRINFDDNTPRTMPDDVRQFLTRIKNRDAAIRKEIGEKLLKSANQDWNPNANLSVNELAEQIVLDSVQMYYPGEDAEIFYRAPKDIFGGHSIATFANFEGNITEPYLAG